MSKSVCLKSDIIVHVKFSENTALTELFEAGAGLQQDVANIMNGPGIQLAEGHLQKHAVEGRDQIHILQAVRQRLSDNESRDFRGHFT